MMSYLSSPGLETTYGVHCLGATEQKSSDWAERVVVKKQGLIGNSGVAG